MKTRLLLVSERQRMRHRLRDLLEDQRDCEVVAEASDGRQAVRLLESHRPNVVIVDMITPVLTGIMTTRRILAHSAATRVIVVSGHSDDAYVTYTRDAGAAGFVLADSADVDLLRAVREVSQGGFFLSPGLRGPTDEASPCGNRSNGR